MKTAALALAFAATAYGQSLTEALAANPDLSNLTTLIQPYAQQFAGLTNITLLAPNNEAISEFLNTSTGAEVATQPDLIQAILSYHVLNGSYENITNTTFIPTSLEASSQYANVTGGQRVEAVGSDDSVTFFSGLLANSSVVNTTVFDNGVIHVIDQFLVLPPNVTATAVALNLTSAVGALVNTSLADTVVSTQDITLFIPNNAAFQRIGGNLANLSTEELASILQYHVVAGSVLYSTELMNGSSVASLQGNNLTVTIEDDTVYVNNAEVIRPNVLVSNGVIHVIDRVLNPDNTTAMPNPSTTEEAFPGATSASDEPFTSGVATPTSAIPTDDIDAAQSSASEGGAWRPIETGAIGMAALFGGAAAVFNM